MTTLSKIRFLIITLALSLLLIWGMLQFIQIVPAEAFSAPNFAITPTQLPDQPLELDSPNISLIDSPTPSCVLPLPNTGICYITWNYIYASSDPNYMITMTVSIDDRARARYQGFFQTNMYVPSELATFRVACGIPGSGGDPDWGLNHNYIIRGRDSAGEMTSNSGQVNCPPDIIKIYFPFLRE